MSHPDSNSPQSPPADSWHRRTLEHKSALFAVITTLAISVGGLVEIVPLFTVSAGPQAMAEVTPYTPLEQAGRDIYAREGCVQCHSQMVRPFRAETYATASGAAPESTASTVRSCWAPGASAPTCTAWAENTPTCGTTST
jgi:hypothetical protein